MLNRGFELMPQLGNEVDMLMAESVHADWQPGQPPGGLFPDQVYKDYVRQLQAMQQQNRKLKIYTLDYWPPTDPQGIKRIYAMQRSKSFIPYVSTPDLQAVVPEPK